MWEGGEVMHREKAKSSRAWVPTQPLLTLHGRDILL